MAVRTLEDLFAHNLKDVYNAEKQLLKALPKMAKNSTSDRLRQAFEDHLEQTQGQVQRLEEVFASLELPVRGIKCAAMEGLVEEASEIFEEEFSDSARDAALIAAAQKVEHYEIASYGTLVAFAKLLGHTDAQNLLIQTLDEEKSADDLLTEIAESEINVEAEEGADEGEESEEEEPPAATNRRAAGAKNQANGRRKSR